MPKHGSSFSIGLFRLLDTLTKSWLAAAKFPL
jgi:hypothetical protein